MTPIRPWPCDGGPLLCRPARALAMGAGPGGGRAARRVDHPRPIVGSTKQAEPRVHRGFPEPNLPPGATWFRLEGDLREAPGAAPYTYTLHDLSDDSRAMRSSRPGPCQTGHVQITGRPDGPWLPGTFLSIQADVPTEPPATTWILFRRSRPSSRSRSGRVDPGLPGPAPRGPRSDHGGRPAPLPASGIAARWAGWIGNERLTISMRCQPARWRVLACDAGGLPGDRRRRAWRTHRHAPAGITPSASDPAVPDIGWSTHSSSTRPLPTCSSSSTT